MGSSNPFCCVCPIMAAVDVATMPTELKVEDGAAELVDANVDHVENETAEPAVQYVVPSHVMYAPSTYPAVPVHYAEAPVAYAAAPTLLVSQAAPVKADFVVMNGKQYASMEEAVHDYNVINGHTAYSLNGVEKTVETTPVEEAAESATEAATVRA